MAKSKRSYRIWVIAITCIVIGVSSLLMYIVLEYPPNRLSPEEVLQLYCNYLNDYEYDKMYVLLDEVSQESIDQETFVTKHRNIYEGIEMANLEIEVKEVIKEDKLHERVYYDMRMDTIAGEITFSNHALLSKDPETKSYMIRWYPQIIFPNLNPKDKVRVRTLKGQRGEIYDKKGRAIAKEGMVSSVGLVPGKMGDNIVQDIEKLAALLELSVEIINKKLNASYVQLDTFVPLKKIAKANEELEEALLQIKGVKITDSPSRVYPFGEEVAHLVGYIQNVNAEDLEKLEGEGYNANSIIGRAGLEKNYEEQLRGIDGYEIVIMNEANEVKETLAKKSQKNGQVVRLTIDMDIQSILYNQLKDDKGCAVAMNPKTGEVLALVSTPSFDSNDFVLGLSPSKWESLNEDPNQPLFNRFRATLCPGSGFKSVIGAIGLTTGTLQPDDNYGNEGLSWQKDASWGGYKVTTLKEYGSEVVLRNALIYSDNIYFAKAALNIGAETLARELRKMGFDETIPFEVGVYSSSFSNTDNFESEIQLADSGYGQAQILVNPLHMASIYSAFVNEGNMIKPYLIRNIEIQPSYWKTNVFTEEAVKIICEDLIQVVEKAGGGIAKVEGLTLAGKTGTAEIKQTKDDHEGTELGWFNVFTVNEEIDKSLLVISMIEDVKGRGGAGYVIPKVKMVFENLKEGGK